MIPFDYTNNNPLILNHYYDASYYKHLHMLAQEESSNNTNQPKRKRRFKIFQSVPKSQPSSLLIQSFSKHQPQQELPPRRRELVKLTPKDNLHQEFYSGIEGDEQIEMLQPQMGFYQTVQSNLCGQTKFMSSTPSFMFKNNQLTISESSILYHSVQTIKESYCSIEAQFRDILEGVKVLEGSMSGMEVKEEEGSQLIREVEGFLDEVRIENQRYDRRIKEIDLRIESIQYLMELQSKRKEHSPSQEIHEGLQEIPHSIGFELLLKQQEEDDEFAESHYLPAQLITRYMKERQLQREQQQSNSKPTQYISLFHPIFLMGKHQYRCLLDFILQEFPERKEESIDWRLLFRRGTTDLSSEWVGSKGELQYKENLLFLLKTSTGKRIGGFISNDLIEEETMSDCHAFLFTLQDNCHKFKIKEECQSQAFMASKHYIVTFSSDLMISNNCLEEESYCEWPSSYAAKDDTSSHTWLAGDFWFMIQHIEVFQILMRERK